MHIGGERGNVCGSNGVMRGAGIIMLILSISFRDGVLEEMERKKSDPWFRSSKLMKWIACRWEMMCSSLGVA